MSETKFTEGTSEVSIEICEKNACCNDKTHDNDKFCYPHSRWYRPIKRYYNLLISKLEDMELIK